MARGRSRPSVLHGVILIGLTSVQLSSVRSEVLTVVLFVCFVAASGRLTDDIQAGLQAIVKNISSGSVKVKRILWKPGA